MIHNRAFPVFASFESIFILSLSEVGEKSRRERDFSATRWLGNRFAGNHCLTRESSCSFHHVAWVVPRKDLTVVINNNGNVN